MLVVNAASKALQDISMVCGGNNGSSDSYHGPTGR